jgi:F-type H+-transporting ATPase subunit b
MFLSLDGTFWIQIINFFVFFAILNVVYIKPAAEALRKRREYIDSVQAEYEAAQREVRDLKGQAETKRAEARREGDQAAVGTRAEAQRKSDAIVSEGQSKAQSIIEAAQQTVHSEVKEAQAKEGQLVNDLADTMLSRAIGSV